MLSANISPNTTPAPKFIISSAKEEVPILNGLGVLVSGGRVIFFSKHDLK
jgi:hypothetical protein